MHKNPPALQEHARDMRHEATDAEHWLWQRLRDRRLLGVKFRRQVPIGHYIVDFVCKERRLVVEIDGSQHQGQQDYDQHRTAFLEQQGYRVVRYWNNDVLAQGEAVLEDLIRVLEGITPGRLE